MPLDPSIISSYNPTSGIDLNALMTQRMQGMANINAMERQRQADALALEDRAAAQQAEQQKAQEAATLKALLPAYTYGIQTGDMAGALNLVPPDMQESLAPYVDALAGKSPQEVQAALIGSLSSSSAGQEALAAIQRAQTFGVQQGQLDVSRKRLAFDIEQAAAEAAAGGVSPDVAARLQFEREKLAAETAKGTAEETKKRLADEKRAKDIEFAVKEVEAAAKPGGLIDQSTGSYIGNLVDTAAQAVGMGTYGAIANAQMKPVADLVLKLVPRFEGPQSDKDTQSYKDAAGDLANPNLPASVKRAAATQIVTLLKKYSGQFEYGGEDTSGDTVDDSNPLLSTP